MIYTAWGKDGRANTLIEGEGPPRFGDGSPYEDATDLVWRIEAASWEEAMKQYHELQGWERYVPMRLRRYWVQFDQEDPDVPSPLRLGCGVTAWTRDDALFLLGREVGDFVIRAISEDVDVSTLDLRHVLPNMAPPSVRGIWYPLGYQRNQ